VPGLLASLIDFCEAELTRLSDVVTPAVPVCPACEARGPSIVVRGGAFSTCLVCGLTPSPLPLLPNSL